MPTIPSTREAILEAFRGLPLEEQREVAEAVNQELHRSEISTGADQSGQPHPGSPGWVSWRQLTGLLANGKEPPSDEQVQQWIDEARMEKYGG
jgi:hypothetical protein